MGLQRVQDCLKVVVPGVVLMPLYWLCYRHNNSISVVIQPAHSLIYARLRASLDESEFTEDPKWRTAEFR